MFLPPHKNKNSAGKTLWFDLHCIFFRQKSYEKEYDNASPLRLPLPGLTDF